MNESPVDKTQLAQHARAFIDAHGRIAVTIFIGGVLAALGTLLPFAYVSTLFGSTSYSLIQGGFFGVALIVISLGLALLPIKFKQYARFNLIAFGVACALFGVFFAIWLATSGLLSALGSSAGGLAIGFYLSILGYGAMVFGYYRMQPSLSEITS